jgi:predicted GTPase
VKYTEMSSKEGYELRRLANSIDNLSLNADAVQYSKIMDALKDKEDQFAKLAEETVDHMDKITETIKTGLSGIGCNVESTANSMNTADVQYNHKGKTYNINFRIEEVK